MRTAAGLPFGDLDALRGLAGSQVVAGDGSILEVVAFDDGHVGLCLPGTLAHHNPSGPAASWPDGRIEWYRDGVLHRIDGPAVVSADGLGRYAVEGWLVDPDDPRLQAGTLRAT